jgi:hypothetical protein
LRNPGKLTYQVVIVIGGDAVDFFKTALLANVDDADSFFLIQLKAYRPHKPFTIAFTIAGDVEIDMQAIKAERTMVTAAAPFVFADFLPALFAEETFVVLNHVFSDVHIFNNQISNSNFYTKPLTKFRIFTRTIIIDFWLKEEKILFGFSIILFKII